MVGKKIILAVFLFGLFSALVLAQSATNVSSSVTSEDKYIATFENEDLQILVELQHYGSTNLIQMAQKVLKITFVNKQEIPIKIIWDESVFTDNNGKPARLIKEGQRFIVSDQPQVPSILPPGERASFLAVPQSHITYSSSSGWFVTGISGNIRKRTLMIAYEINNVKKYAKMEIEFETVIVSKSAPDRLTFPTLSYLSPVSNTQGETIGYEGISFVFLGYVSRNYYNPMKPGSWNNFWQWGTIALFVPYIGIGTEYINNDNSFTFSVYTIYILPIIDFAFSF
uniref:Uncharacterized protein n=1 Tax=Fervidobacterium pennivorans TaxID=93466 RepID=A0A7V4KC33_FERPE